MTKQQDIINKAAASGLVPLYFHPSKSVSLKVLQCLYAAGVRVVEYTNRGAEALENFAYMKQHCNDAMPGLYLGIGTIKDAAAAAAFAQAGADFIISPGFAVEVAEAANQAGLLYIPGCMTPAEIMQAEKHGARFVKLFPGEVLGPAFARSVKDLFAGLLFMPTGGVDITPQSLQAWFAAGVCAVGMGSKLLPAKVLAEIDADVLTANVRQLLQTIKTVREND